MMTPVEIIPLFSVPLYRSTMAISDSVKRSARDLGYFRIDAGNGYQSVNTRVLDEPEFNSIKIEIMSQVDFFSAQLCVSPGISFKLTNSWMMKHMQGDWAQEHSHTNSLLSGIVYIDTDGTSGDINFNSRSSIFPSAVDVEFSAYNIYNSRGWTITPQTGDVLIFPSTLLHSVSKNIYNKARYCLSFNMFMQGGLGSVKDSINQLNLNVS
jgi:uncharacterized protein (TIGR02466 family)